MGGFGGCGPRGPIDIPADIASFVAHVNPVFSSKIRHPATRLDDSRKKSWARHLVVYVVIQAHLERHPGAPVVLLGLSNGGRVGMQIEIWLRKLGSPVLLLTTASPLRGTQAVTSMRRVAEYWYNKETLDEYPAPTARGCRAAWLVGRPAAVLSECGAVVIIVLKTYKLGYTELRLYVVYFLRRIGSTCQTAAAAGLALPLPLPFSLTSVNAPMPNKMTPAVAIRPVQAL